ncbi:esterase family protein [Corynebacterium genitalium ATCC 33030]|uniref:Acyl-CoA:diacylglycerol acyltransferase n=1 Tax=Corynebacterium genitalium ATCC 33030 TaxID=585529 RepID=D7WB87_9CORY|nr:MULTISPECIES: alpha/beta hydrolase family protein [Corynebacterium]MCQ4617517.1 esterase family protein [Corynebacterium pseudogenitalium]EFK55118.1 putative esterase [Corynebacterium genitalium ATCC 33030]MCQ4620559.1 esterase family protein [Corynebacterium sp. CCUG 71335]MCQ4622570.1 esterase family protein [Corynebacterium sp. CCUG 70398]MCQ4626288.1 esterase family protein [Corynebacterium sp. CCUG 65737]
MKFLRSALAVAAATSIALGAAPAIAQAAPVSAAQAAGQAPVGVVKNWDANPAPKAINTGETAKWVHEVDHNKVWAFWVHSPSMGRDIPVAVIPARNAQGQPVKNAPTVYLLNGAGGAEQNNDWLTYAETQKFYADKGVNVVIPMEGAFSYYTDWLNTPNAKYFRGPQKWETFLTKELPGPIENRLGADSRRAVVGFSMSGTSALVLPTKVPGFYDAAASFSGCAATSSPAGYNFARLTVNRGAGSAANYQTVTPEQMWGPMGGPYNRANDALVNADKLRGTNLYVSTATGLASENDMVSTLVGKGAQVPAASANAMVLQVEGGVIEAAINTCNHDLKAKLNSLNIPAHYEFRNVGTHSWPDWRKDLENSWYKTIKPAFGM